MISEEGKASIDKIIHDRRSIYPIQFNGQKVADAVIQNILENANQAPTHHYTEPWRFIIFKEDRLKRLAQYFVDEYKLNTPATELNEKKIEKYQAIPSQVSHIIAIYMKRQAAKEIPEIEEILAVGCAIQNIYLSVNEYGLGGYLSTGTGTYSKSTKTFLGLEEDETLIGFFYIGCYDGNKPRGKKRGAIETKITYF